MNGREGRVGPRRILLTTDAVGGVWRYTVTLAAEWASMGIVPVVAVLGPAPAPEARRALRQRAGSDPIATGLPLDWTAPDAGALARVADALAALAHDHRVDIVHLHAPALLGAARWPVPVIATIHSCLRTWWRAVRGDAPLPPDLAWRDAATARGLAAVAAVIAPSASFADAVAHAYRPATPVRTVVNGLPPAAIATGPGDRGGSSGGVLACGRLWDEAKDLATLERAAHLLPPDCAVEAAGALAGPNGARAPTFRRIHALGALDDAGLASARARARVFAAPSRYEPFGLAVGEAAQDGLALVLADIPSARELWDGAALFFPPGDHAGLSRALATALADSAPLGRAARERARRFDAARFARETLSVHDDALAMRAA